jgi:hypothetical protein
MQKVTRLPLISSSSRSLPGAHPEEMVPRLAAVSPTFGRLFEGTDLNTAGQTSSQQRSRITSVTPVTLVWSPVQFLRAMFPNGWPATLKPVSFCQCRSRAGRHLTSQPEQTNTQPTAGAGTSTNRRADTRHRATTKRDTVLSTPVDNHVDNWSSFHLSTLVRTEGGIRR